jgi:hypothetical protein
VAAKKQFLSRTARYSGLLNVLQFEAYDGSTQSQLETILADSNAWLGFNVPSNEILKYAQLAVDSKLRRLLFTTELSNKSINSLTLDEFSSAIALTKQAGIAFTGIRHGSIIPGSEDNAYEIVNSTTSLMESTVERGVLARIAAELLLLDKADGQECGVSSSNQFAAAYLNVLRSSGLTRSQEVDKMFSGGLQRVAQLTATNYEVQTALTLEEKQRREKLKVRDLFMFHVPSY